MHILKQYVSLIEHYELRIEVVATKAQHFSQKIWGRDQNVCVLPIYTLYDVIDRQTLNLLLVFSGSLLLLVL